MYIDSIKAFFVIVVSGISILKLYLNWRQTQAIKAHYNNVPHDFANQINLAEHQKAANYNLAKLRVSNSEIIVSTLMLILFTIGGGIELINNALLPLHNYPLSMGVAVIVVFSVINAIISLPFSLYSTFCIEQKFGFNNTTVSLFISDLIKNTLVSAAIMLPLMYVILWLMNVAGNYWWLLAWLVLVMVNLLFLVIYPVFIAPIFNKFTPLEDMELKQRIELLLKKCGFTTRGVFVMDGSGRSSHGSAYFTGIGKAKRIVFFDTLIKQLNYDEIEAVLAHELGHFKKKHVLKQIIFSFALTFVALFILSLLLKSQVFFLALGVNTISNYNGLLLFLLLSGIVTLPLAPISSYLLRKNEFEADDFANCYSQSEHLIAGLVKLYRDNASTLTPDPLYVRFYYSHPPASVRIAHLRQTHSHQ